MAPFDRSCTTWYWFVMVTIVVVLSCTIFESFAFDSPLGGPCPEYCYNVDVLSRNTRMVYLPEGKKSVRIYLAVSTEYQRVTVTDR